MNGHLLQRAGTALGKLLGGVLWLPAGYLLARIGAQHAWITALVALLALGGCAYLLSTRLTPEGRRGFREGAAIDATGSTALLLMLVALCTAGFTSLSVFAYNLGAGTVEGGPLTGADLVDAAYASYMWHLLDAIPLIDVPQTLNWTLAHPFTDTFQGALTLAYLLVVVLPLIYAATQVLVRWTSDTRSDVPPAGEQA
jgi:hypothetical protein